MRKTKELSKDRDRTADKAAQADRSTGKQLGEKGTTVGANIRN